ncbi:DUF1611 domain-containing protein [Halobacterium yunchengense]|uniref:DUF1611 domain-containing protein n=1 Tax=Halobacterium yunchengense TaxID=3108497 RepID=UPI00300B239D
MDDSEPTERRPAVVLAEGAFGDPAGKTANGVALDGTRFDVRAVVDSTRAGSSARDVLGRGPDVPVVASVADALDASPTVDALVVGVAPAGGELPESWTDEIATAIRRGCDVVSGLHTFLSEDPEWRSLADECGVSLVDVRKPPEERFRVADGSAEDVDATVVLTAGTDCAVGKRTTTVELYRAARDAGLDAGWVATGQTGLMIGADAGAVIDRVPADFAAGAVESLVVEVAADHDYVFVEGQAALTHRAYAGVTLSLLHGASPDAVVLVDDPGRARRDDFDQWPVDGVAAELAAIDALSAAPVAAVSTWGDEREVASLPAANVREDGGPERLLAAVRGRLEREE